MELRHLTTFQAVVREGSFLRAADVLGYAQPTITLHIQQLEAALGVQLFTRQGKRMQLTEAGRVLQEHATQVLTRTALLQQTMTAMTTGDAGHARLGAIETVAYLRLPPHWRRSDARGPRCA
jgi:DNA-binding transcriptional LysR family regulator